MISNNIPKKEKFSNFDKFEGHVTYMTIQFFEFRNFTEYSLDSSVRLNLDQVQIQLLFSKM